MASTIHLPYPGQTERAGLCGQKIFNPGTPFEQNIGNIYPGKMIFISGIPDSKCERFAVNFVSGEDVAFHFNPRIGSGRDNEVIVRNTKKDGKWGSEERSLGCPFPFKRDKYFELIILVEPSCYKVAVNDYHFLEFNHRIPLEKVDKLNIRGDVRVTSVRIQG